MATECKKLLNFAGKWGSNRKACTLPYLLHSREIDGRSKLERLHYHVPLDAIETKVNLSMLGEVDLARNGILLGISPNSRYILAISRQTWRDVNEKLIVACELVNDRLRPAFCVSRIASKNLRRISAIFARDSTFVATLIFNDGEVRKYREPITTIGHVNMIYFKRSISISYDSLICFSNYSHSYIEKKNFLLEFESGVIINGGEGIVALGISDQFPSMVDGSFTSRSIFKILRNDDSMGVNIATVQNAIEVKDAHVNPSTKYHVKLVEESGDTAVIGSDDLYLFSAQINAEEVIYHILDEHFTVERFGCKHTKILDYEVDVLNVRSSLVLIVLRVLITTEDNCGPYGRKHQCRISILWNLHNGKISIEGIDVEAMIGIGRNCWFPSVIQSNESVQQEKMDADLHQQNSQLLIGSTNTDLIITVPHFYRRQYL